jgi:peptidoglycan/xylan/chitin deacetylase (PgdA/CDA1 family)
MNLNTVRLQQGAVIALLVNATLATTLTVWAVETSIDVVAAGPKFETEPIELNSNVGFEDDTRERDYKLLPLPTGAPSPKLDFVSPGAGGFGHAAKITADADQAGMLVRNVSVDKGQRITFSVKVRAEDVRAVQLAAVPLPRGGMRPPIPRGNVPRKSPSPRRMPVHRSKTLSGSFDWTTFHLDTAFTGNIDEAQFQVIVQGPGTVWIDDFSVAVHWPKIVEIPKRPVAPLLVMVLMHSETPQAYIRNRDYFRADAMKYEEMAKMLQRYGARLVAQPERELWLGAKRYDPDFIRRLHERYGVSFSAHTHGPNPRMNPSRQDVLNYIKLRKEELETMGAGPVTDLNGNFDQPDWDIFADVGIRTMTAYKNVRTQMGQMAMEHYYLHPWRPAGSPYQGEEKWATHRPECRVVYLPGAGAVHTRHHERFAELMERHLRVALSRVRADRINVFYFVEHVGRFVPRKPGVTPWQYVNSQAFRDDLEQHEKLYRDFLAPLVKSGHVRFVVPSEICDMFEEWERKMGIAAETSDTMAPRESDEEMDQAEIESAKGYITFAINTHDWMHVDESADIILRLIDLFERYGVRGDFYLTAPITHHYAESRPDVIRRLRESNMTISYHIRPPHILYPGFNQRLRELDDDELVKTLRDYETYRLDMTTGKLLRDQVGGYTYVAEVFGRKPVALGIPTGNPRERSVARRVYRELGARVVVEYHESGTKLDRPFEWVDGLLIRPSDFSVTRWRVYGMRGRPAFWWNMLSTPRAADFNPTAYLKRRLAEWHGPRPPLITCLIHENNFYRTGATPWALIYYTDIRKTRPRKPPFNLAGPDASVPRSSEDREAIWRAYEELVAYAAANLKVITSEDIVRMAESAERP